MSKISVIVPVYKVENYIKRCVDSILSQTFTDFDLILVDDGSPDNCGKICDEYATKDKRIKVIHKENGGLSDARNAGLDYIFANSDSEWVNFIDSDDWVHTEYLSILYNAAVKNHVNVSCCFLNPHNYYDGDTSYPIKELKTELLTAEEIFCKSYNLWNYGIQNNAHAKLYRKKFFKEIRYPFGRFYEDAFTTHKILFQEDVIAVVEEPLYFYFINNDGITRSNMTEKKIADKFDGKKCRMEFFANKGLIAPFNLLMKEYCYHIQRFLFQFSSDKNKKNILLKNKKYLFDFFKNNNFPNIKTDINKVYKAELKNTKKILSKMIRSDYKSSEFNVKSLLYFMREKLRLALFKG